MFGTENNERNAGMTIPRSVLYNSLKDAIETKSEDRIGELADLLYGNMDFTRGHALAISENSARIDIQHKEILGTLDVMKEGFRQIDKRFEQVDKRFEQVDKRFDDLIHQMDKRFEAVDKKFRFQTWLIGTGFVSINTMVVLLKIFG